MYSLLKVGTYDLPNPEGSFNVNKDDVVNEYQCEDGHKTLEIIRQNAIKGSASYKGLTAEQISTIQSHLDTVTSFTIYDPLTNSTKQISARVSGIKVGKVFYRNNISLWTLSFDIEEL